VDLITEMWRSAGWSVEADADRDRTLLARRRADGEATGSYCERPRGDRRWTRRSFGRRPSWLDG